MSVQQRCIEECITGSSAVWDLSTWADIAVIGASVATVLAVIVAWIGISKTIKNSRDLAKKTQTLNMIVGGEITKLHENGIRVLKEHPNNGAQTIARLAVDKKTLEADDQAKADALYEMLNWYEYLAAGVRHDILSEEYLRNSSFTTMNYIWDDAQLFVQGVRKRNNSQTFCEAFEELINRWKEVGYSGKLPSRK